MPIYEYRCTTCGFQKEFIQKLSDPLHTVCPECGKQSFEKMLSAAGFQLKGSGWYATDFKNGGSKPAAKKSEETKTGADKPAAGGEADASATPANKPATESVSTSS